MTAATRSSRFIRHRRRSIRSPHRPAPPSPTHRKIRFRRAGCPQPAARQPPHHHGGVRARRPTQVFRHFRRGGRPCPLAGYSTAPHVKLPVIAKPVRTLAVAIRSPVPRPHGEAVTGGFFSRTHGKARVPCPTKMLCRAGPMCPAPTARPVCLRKGGRKLYPSFRKRGKEFHSRETRRAPFPNPVLRRIPC